MNPAALNFTSGTFDLTSDNLNIGSGGLFGSALALSSGMTVNVTDNASIAAGASLTMQGGEFSAATLSNSGTIGGSGQINAPLTNTSAGLVRALASDYPIFTGASNVNEGQIQLSGGAVEFTGALTNGAPGTLGPGGLITGNGSLIVGGGLFNLGNVALSAETNITGTVTNGSGGLVDTASGTTTFWGNLVNSGTIRTESGASTVFYGAVSGSGAFAGPGTASFESDLAITTSDNWQTMDGSVVLADNLVVNGSGTLAFGSSSSITETGGSNSLTMSGAGGTLILSGTDRYTGGTNVDAGTLYVTDTSAIADGTSLIVGAGGTFIFDPTFVAASNDTTAASDATTVVAPVTIPSQTTATTAAPVAANLAAPNPVSLSAPQAVAASVSDCPATPSMISVFDSAGDSPIPSSKTVASPVVALPLPTSVPSSRTKGLSKVVTVGALNTLATDQTIWWSIARRAAGDLAWLKQAARGSDNSDQQRKKDVAILALDTVFAQYGYPAKRWHC